jgi:8-oxo-dGTP pyrophosphatase MutT (NUDIX family)
VPRYKDPSFPPSGAWDRRLSDVACDGLQPVETLHENSWFALRNRGGYFTVEYHLRHVAVLPVISRDSVAMVRVKRPVIGDETLELPAGGIESGEQPASAAARELAEETGIHVSDIGRFVPMTPIAVSSTRMPKLSYVFRVEVSEQEFAARRPHDNEIHSVERIAVEQLPGMMARGEIYVSVPLAILGIFLTSSRNFTLGAI